MRSLALSSLAALGALFIACGPSKGSHTEEGWMPSGSAALEPAPAPAPHQIKTVFVIVMENKNWSAVHGNPSAPYINDTLLRAGAHAERYTNGGIHPSEPNYIWLEAGDDLGIRDNDDPAANYRTTKNHLTTQMEAAGVTWKSYQEGIEADRCPLASGGRYAAKHNPFVFFDDVTGGRTADSARCVAHVRPYAELAHDLEDGKVAQYNFITPDLCNDMHDSKGCDESDSVANGDAWLSREVPKILASSAYRENGVLFIAWDESDSGGSTPIGLIALSPLAKAGYANEVAYDHSSLVRTVQDIFSLRPFMRHAANAEPLGDLFNTFP